MYTKSGSPEPRERRRHFRRRASLLVVDVEVRQPGAAIGDEVDDLHLVLPMGSAVDGEPLLEEDAVDELVAMTSTGLRLRLGDAPVLDDLDPTVEGGVVEGVVGLRDD